MPLYPKSIIIVPFLFAKAAYFLCLTPVRPNESKLTGPPPPAFAKQKARTGGPVERVVRRHLARQMGPFETFGCGSYRPETGVNPALEIAGAASGDPRKRISAVAASGC